MTPDDTYTSREIAMLTNARLARDTTAYYAGLRDEGLYLGDEPDPARKMIAAVACGLALGLAIAAALAAYPAERVDPAALVDAACNEGC